MQNAFFSKLLLTIVMFEKWKWIKYGKKKMGKTMQDLEKANYDQFESF